MAPVNQENWDHSWTASFTSKTKSCFPHKINRNKSYPLCSKRNFLSISRTFIMPCLSVNINELNPTTLFCIHLISCRKQLSPTVSGISTSLFWPTSILSSQQTIPYDLRISKPTELETNYLFFFPLRPFYMSMPSPYSNNWGKIDPYLFIKFIKFWAPCSALDTFLPLVPFSLLTLPRAPSHRLCAWWWHSCLRRHVLFFFFHIVKIILKNIASISFILH